MYEFEFKSRLSRLNPRLFIDDGRRTQLEGDWSLAALFLRHGERSRVRFSSSDLQYVAKSMRETLTAQHDGTAPEFICGVPHGWIPERDVFSSTSGKFLARGWRTTLMFLAKRKLIDLQKARRVFDCSSLGQTEYDHASYAQKLKEFVNAI